MEIGSGSIAAHLLDGYVRTGAWPRRRQDPGVRVETATARSATARVADASSMWRCSTSETPDRSERWD
jgi:hypothetical protein